jgi:hypothetical protein
MPEPVATIADPRDALLAMVDFKWLMSGQGWWVDTARFHADPAYAWSLLELALASSSFALRECAGELRARLQTECGAEPGTA